MLTARSHDRLLCVCVCVSVSGLASKSALEGCTSAPDSLAHVRTRASSLYIPSLIRAALRAHIRRREGYLYPSIRFSISCRPTIICSHCTAAATCVALRSLPQEQESCLPVRCLLNKTTGDGNAPLLDIEPVPSELRTAPSEYIVVIATSESCTTPSKPRPSPPVRPTQKEANPHGRQGPDGYQPAMRV